MLNNNVTYEGRIVKGIAGFYYVHTEDLGLVECHAKGIFRKDGKKPLVGDRVALTITDEDKKQGVISSIYCRINSLNRPEVANIDQVIILFAFRSPNPNLDLLDKFLISIEMQNIPAIICFNKLDLATQEERKSLRDIYADCGSPIISVSAASGIGLENLKSLLVGKTTALAGTSGVGKSTLINALCPGAGMLTGEISRKSERGKHTTRHSELFYLQQKTYLMDTPGFSSFLLKQLEAAELKEYYQEFYPYEGCCRFQPCSHMHEPDCKVIRAVEERKIHPRRYESYRQIYQELKNVRKY